MKLAEMEYDKEKFKEKNPILACGEDNRFQWFIINVRHSHPCSYIAFSFEPSEEMRKVIDDNVHGGITFDGDQVPNYPFIGESFLRTRNVIGWDYAHCGDADAYFEFEGDRKWTTDELIAEMEKVLAVIRPMIGEMK